MKSIEREAPRLWKWRVLSLVVFGAAAFWPVAPTECTSGNASAKETAGNWAESEQNGSSDFEANTDEGLDRAVRDITWSTMDAGGGISASDSATLEGTMGQVDAGKMTGSGLTMYGGFWPVTLNSIFADGFESGDTSAWGP